MKQFVFASLFLLALQASSFGQEKTSGSGRLETVAGRSTLKTAQGMATHGVTMGLYYDRGITRHVGWMVGIREDATLGSLLPTAHERSFAPSFQLWSLSAGIRAKVPLGQCFEASAALLAGILANNSHGLYDGAANSMGTLSFPVEGQTGVSYRASEAVSLGVLYCLRHIKEASSWNHSVGLRASVRLR